jgi:hypothetical protein
VLRSSGEGCGLRKGSAGVIPWAGVAEVVVVIVAAEIRQLSTYCPEKSNKGGRQNRGQFLGGAPCLFLRSNFAFPESCDTLEAESAMTLFIKPEVTGDETALA